MLDTVRPKEHARWQLDAHRGNGALGFSDIAMQTLNHICECRGIVEGILHDLPEESTSYESSCPMSLHQVVAPQSPTAWIDDASLESYAEHALRTKMLIVEARNFATDRIRNIFDEVPVSDLSEDVAALHGELYLLYPDYEMFKAF